MQTYPLNALAEQLEVDRSTMVKAMRDIPADVTRKGNRPTWRIATASKALAAYKQRIADAKRRRHEGNGTLTSIAIACEQAFERYQEGEAAMVALPTLAARRKAAHELVPLAKQALQLMHERDVKSGLHTEHVELKSQAVTQLIVRGFEGVCEWTHFEAWSCFNPDDGDEREAA